MNRAFCKRHAAYLGAAVLLTACANPLVDPEVVVGLRVLGARVAANAQNERADLRAGETADLDWWVVAEQPTDYVATVAWCLGKETRVGLQECEAAPFLQQELGGDSTTPLHTEFALPDAARAEHWLAWVGVCEKAAPRFDWRNRSFECASGQAVEGVYKGRVLAAGMEVNHNPELSDDGLRLGSTAWPALTRGVVPGQPCTDQTLPKVRAGQTLHLHWRTGSEDREPLKPDGQYEAPERESLVFTHVATAPGLERAFSALDWNSDKSGFDLDFELPKTPRPPSAGRSVGVYLVARDERGGSAFEGRELCVVP